ncbi:uncharacterized protein MCYG_01156 [Microsporum canis CBS 113480]|uniref:Uncharacterized protein n=1 Tax=Arthroderma otae (strain ATCC MYA-4605 / CBS 113480) TaxID=554155 RepID=C5FEX4_ARTOC|nr:uncharacterized protein MCYG_01156 [Microsporum canis CBS 113480]EEQ28268.1 predicted protein [Microsporum canis CBS 113480]
MPCFFSPPFPPPLHAFLPSHWYLTPCCKGQNNAKYVASAANRQQDWTDLIAGQHGFWGRNIPSDKSNPQRPQSTGYVAADRPYGMVGLLIYPRKKTSISSSRSITNGLHRSLFPTSPSNRRSILSLPQTALSLIPSTSTESDLTFKRDSRSEKPKLEPVLSRDNNLANQKRKYIYKKKEKTISRSKADLNPITTNNQLQLARRALLCQVIGSDQNKLSYHVYAGRRH